MKKNLLIISFLLFFCIDCFSDSVAVNSSLCLPMGETKVLVEMTNIKIMQNDWYNKNGEVISPAKILAESEKSQFVLICDWYENYPDFSFSNPTSLFIIKYLPVEDFQYHFDNLAYAISYDSIQIIEYSDFRGEWDKYGKAVQKSKIQKIYNPANDKLIFK